MALMAPVELWIAAVASVSATTSRPLAQIRVAIPFHWRFGLVSPLAAFHSFQGGSSSNSASGRISGSGTGATTVVRSGLASGAGLEPAPPAAWATAGALAVELP